MSAPDTKRIAEIRARARRIRSDPWRGGKAMSPAHVAADLDFLLALVDQARTEGAMEERKATVRYLRAGAADALDDTRPDHLCTGYSEGMACCGDGLADNIERGAHIPDAPTSGGKDV
jgi:hypothetical protein